MTANRFRRLLVGAILIAIPATGACSRHERAPDVILFTIDTLRADVVGAPAASWVGRTSPTPLADSWASEGVLFERAYAPRGQTHPSLASILTGKYPAAHGLRRNGMPLRAEETPLPVLLKRAGYRTAAFCSGLDRARFPFWQRGFDIAEDGTGNDFLAEARRPEGQREWDERATAACERFIASLPAHRDGDAPLFLWVHLFDAHEPYTPDPSDAAKYRDDEYDGILRSDPANPGAGNAPKLRAYTLGTQALKSADIAHVRDLYLASVKGCDSKLQRIADALAKKGRLEGALRIYSADHGEDLGEHHRYFGHGNSIYDTSLHVPLVIAGPGAMAKGRRVSALVQNFDVFATILDAAGLRAGDLPSGVEALDLMPLVRGESGATGREFVIAEWEDLIFSASDGSWKLIDDPGGYQPRNPPFDATPGIGFPYRCRELYNVGLDPLEQNDEYRKGHPEARRLKAVLERFLSDPAHRTAVSTSTEDAALRELGYVGHASSELPRIECGEDK